MLSTTDATETGLSAALGGWAVVKITEQDGQTEWSQLRVKYQNTT